MLDYSQYSKTMYKMLLDVFSVAPRLTYNIIREEIKSIEEGRSKGDREFFRRIIGSRIDNMVKSYHRLVMYSLYSSEPGLGRVMARRAGKVFAEYVLGDDISIHEAIIELARLGIGLFSFKGCKRGRCVYKVYSCISCSGIEDSGLGSLCEWEAGIIEHLNRLVTGRSGYAREVKCWGLGYRYCEFNVIVV